jgi:DNA invertase Pin-like site-specific DNA recombinase
VVAESLDRLSRNQADIATIYQLLTFHGVRLVTCEEGDRQNVAQLAAALDHADEGQREAAARPCGGSSPPS